MRFVAMLVVSTAVLVTPQAAAKPGPPAQLVGIVRNGLDTAIVKLDALTLRAVSKGVPAGPTVGYLGRSPGTGGRGAFSVGRAGAKLEFLDFERMRWEGGVSVPGGVRALIWNYADRLVAITGGPTAAVVVINPVTRRVRTIERLGRLVVAVASGGDRVVAVLAPFEGIGPARLAVADDRGRFHKVELAQIRAGAELISTDPYVEKFERPALALDSTGRRAVVISANGMIADVNLETLRVVQHALAERSLAVTHKEASGSARSARWVSAETIAITGTDASLDGGRQSWTAAGLKLIDARDWSVRTIDSTTTDLAFTGVLLAFGGTWDAEARRSVGDGLTGYSVDGTLRFRLFEGAAVWPACVAGSYAYFGDDTDAGGGTRFTIVDTWTGAVVRSVRTRVPTVPVAFLSY